MRNESENTGPGDADEHRAGPDPATGPAGVGVRDGHPRVGTPTGRTRLPARPSTMLWGLLVVGFAAAVVVLRYLGAELDPVAWITGLIIAGGLALIVVGVASVLRRPSRPDPSVGEDPAATRQN